MEVQTVEDAFQREASVLVEAFHREVAAHQAWEDRPGNVVALEEEELFPCILAFAEDEEEMMAVRVLHPSDPVAEGVDLMVVVMEWWLQNAESSNHPIWLSYGQERATNRQSPLESLRHIFLQEIQQECPPCPLHQSPVDHGHPSHWAHSSLASCAPW